MKDTHLEKAMASVLEQLELGPGTPYRLEPYIANLWISTMYRAVVQPSGESPVSLFVKRLPDDPQRRFFFDCDLFFSNEAAAYTTVISAFAEFQRERGITEPVQFTPRCYFAECDGDNDILVLEDLSTQGFTVPCCKRPLELEVLRLLMRKLGQFHALSLALKALRPQFFKEISASVKETAWTEVQITKVDVNCWDQAGRDMFDILVQDEGADGKYAARLRPFATNLSRSLQLTSRSDPGNEPWNVVTHGDLWSNNLLVRSDSCARFIDLQQCRYGSPALDLSSVLFLSMDGPGRARHGDELLGVYHRSLSQFLERLGVDPEQAFPFCQIEEQLKKYGRYGMGVGLLNLPHAMQEDSKGEIRAEGGMTMEDAVSKERGQPTPLCRQRVLDNFRDACDRGYLDY